MHHLWGEGSSPGLALFVRERAVSAELLTEQTDTPAGLPQRLLPADGGVDLQPPDEAFPPFLWKQHNAKLHYAWIPSGYNLKRRTHETEQHVLEKKFFKDCARQEVGRMRAAHRNRKRGIEREVTTESCVTADLAAAFCSCFILMASSLTGLGMKVMSAPSFTRRPIHQSLLYFWATDKTEHTFYATRATLKKWAEVDRIFYETQSRRPLTSFMCRKSLVSKLIAAPWTGQSSSRAPQ